MFFVSSEEYYIVSRLYSVKPFVGYVSICSGEPKHVLDGRNKIIAGASASVMNAPVQNAFAFALCFYQSALHLCESKSRDRTERRDRTPIWDASPDTTDVCRRRVEWAPK